MTKAKAIPAAIRGFTLLELLVTIAILLLLSTLTWTLGPSLLESHWLRTGADLIHNNLSLARQTAVSTGRPSILVMRTTGTNAWKDIAVFSVDPDLSIWTQINAWQSLPRTVLVDNTFSPAWPKTVGIQSAIGLVGAPSAPITREKFSLVHDEDYLSVGFFPDGSIVAKENIAIKVITKPTDTAASANPHNFVILLAERAGGRVKVLRPEIE